MTSPYALMDVFTDREAALAVAGLLVITTKEETAHVNMIQRQIQRDIDSGKLPATVTQVEKVREERIGMRRIKMDSNTDDRPVVRHPYTETMIRITRDELKAWCEQRGIYPELLFSGPPPVEKPLHATERQTLLDIIRALAELHGIKPNSGAYRKEAEVLLAELSRKGITAPSNEKTLSKHLAAAFKAR
ncbi:MAG: hypothetical protein H6975_05220 [Gammaproteobacteria bacterium]|nr:hypothetical protein [Gammaproteobacteria bacterium]